MHDHQLTTAIIRATPGRTVLLGGAGSGKTTLLAMRASWLLRTRAAIPGQMLLLAPVRRTALILADRLRAELGVAPQPPVVTFHGLARALLLQHHRAAGYARPPTLVDTPAHYHLLAGMLAAESPADWPWLGSALQSDALRHLVYDLTVGAADNLLAPAELPALALAWGRPDLAELARFYARYLAEQHRLGRVDFGELLATAVDLLARSEIAGSYHARYTHIVVDGFEDANPAQAAILRRLVSTGTDLLVAGDPQQSINGYRSGSSSHLLHCAADLQARIVTIPSGLHCAPRVAQAVAAADPTGAPAPAVPQAPLDSAGPGAGCALLRAFAYPAEEARWVADGISSLLRAGTGASAVAVLFRRGSSLAEQLLTDELRRRGIAYEAATSGVVTADPLVRGAVAVLRLLAGGPGRQPAFVRLLESPLADLPAFGLVALRQALAGAGLAAEDLLDADLSTIALPDDLAAPVAALRARLDNLQERAEWSGPTLLWEIWRSFPAFHADALAGGPSAAACAAFVDEATRRQEEHGWLDLPHLLTLLDGGYFDRLPAAQPSRQGGVWLGTVHAAKGRHWDVVFLPGLIEGSFPLPLSHQDVIPHLLAAPREAGANGDFDQLRRARHLAAERRVFYTALGRARRGLYLSYAQHDPAGGAARRSRFLDSLIDSSAVEVMAAPAVGELPDDLSAAVLHYRRQLGDPDGPVRAQALYALHCLRARWPQAVQAAAWWSNLHETTGAAAPFPHRRLGLSASRLSTFRQCPRRYQFQYHWRLGESTAAATVGLVLHQILEEYHRPGSNRPRTRAALDELLEQYFDPAAYAYRPLANQARRTLSGFLDAYFPRYGDTTALAVELHFAFDFEGHSVTGYIDRIDRLPDDRLELIDYKTGRAMTANSAADDLQLALYDLACYKDAGLRRWGQPGRVAYLYLKHIGPRADGKRGYPPDEESRERLQNRIRRYASLILDERFPSHFQAPVELEGLDAADLERLQAAGDCGYCSYAWICPEAVARAR